MPDDISDIRPGIDRLVAVMAALRTPETGCPWDLKQTHATIAPFTIEEAYEVADAIETGKDVALKSELGDLLFNVVYHARLAEERGAFTFDEVAQAAADKMIRRHPHVFASADDPMAEEARADLGATWAKIKADEHRATGGAAPEGALDGVSTGLPAFMRAVKLQKKAVKAGFDWPDITGLINKLDEEVAELKAGIAARDTENIAGEIGDLLFVLCNVAWRHDLEPETTLRQANAKFTRRFQAMERLMAATATTLADMGWAGRKAMWERAKAETSADAPPVSDAAEASPAAPHSPG